MSFSKETKAELCAHEVTQPEHQKAVAYGMVLFSRVFGASAISHTTESRSAAMLYARTVPELTGSIVELSVMLTRRGGEKRSSYTLSVPDRNDCRRVFEYFSHSIDRPSLRINRANIDGEECLPCFLRGAFLVCGNVSNPEKDYHIVYIGEIVEALTK